MPSDRNLSRTTFPREQGEQQAKVHFYTKRALRDVGLTWRDVPLYCLQLAMTFWGPMHCSVEIDYVIYHCGGKKGCRMADASRYPFAAEETFTVPLDRPVDTSDWIRRRQFTLGRSILCVLGFPTDHARTVNCSHCSSRLLGMGTYRTIGQFRRAIMERATSWAEYST